MSDPNTQPHHLASLSAEYRIDAVCRRFEAAWKSGEQPSVEDFASEWEGPERELLLRELKLIDDDYRRRACETPSLINLSQHSTIHPQSSIPDELLPRPFGRYTLRRLLGRGGMGRVYLAHDPQLDRLVALKMPNPVTDAPGWRDRFLTEARAAATLLHPNVCPVHEVGEVDGQPYLTMGYIEGQTLATKLASYGVFSPQAAVELLVIVARAMQEAHRRGIVHRDLKPANVMLDSAGRPVIMDFGLATRAADTDDLRLTLTGVAMGTPAYMPPEQAGGEHAAIGPPSDVYSLGVVLYELVTGKTPFTANSFGKLLAKIERDPPPAPSALNPQVDAALEAIVLTALAKSPAHRFANAGELADALEQYLSGERENLLLSLSRPYVVPGGDGNPQPTGSTDSPASSRKSSRSRRVLVALAMMAAVLVAVVAAVIYVQTDYGQLVIQLDDREARDKVEVRVNGQEVTLESGGGKVVRVRASANHKLEVKGPDYETVAESYEVKRGEATIASVTLIPKAKVAKAKPETESEVAPKNATAPKPAAQKPAPEDPPKPKAVAFPEASTVFNIPGWEVLADATREQLEIWLDGRRKARQSVMWLDVFEVDQKPCYAAVAALDDRQADWKAIADVSSADVLKMTPLQATVDTIMNRPVALSGYRGGAGFRNAILFHPGRGHWQLGPMTPPSMLPDDIAKGQQDGYEPRLLRPYPTGARNYRYVVLKDVFGDKEQPVYLHDVSPEQMAAFLDDHRRKGYRPVVLSGVPHDNKMIFTTVLLPDANKYPWEYQLDHTAAQLTMKATELSGRGFTPLLVTGYPFDGKTRYVSVWIKEPPRPVIYPKQPTLVELPGWRVLTNAPKDVMQKWLDDRKKEHHSVTWLDATQTADQPLFSAIAALDDRVNEWKAVLDLECRSRESELKKYNALFDTSKYWPASVSGYATNNTYYAAALWQRGSKQFLYGNFVDPFNMKTAIEPTLKNGMGIQIIRPYLMEKGVAVYTMIVERKPGAKREYICEATRDDLREFLVKHRAEGMRPISISACPFDGKLLYAATMEDDATTSEWEVDTELNSQSLPGRAKAMIERGFIPASLTACPWDGAVRYCMVWVKEPTKPVSYPAQPTVVEVDGWRLLMNAPKEQMQKWLEEQKKAKQTVLWLDATGVDGKPLFAAIAAPKGRFDFEWHAFLEVPTIPFPAEVRKLKVFDNNNLHIVSLAPYLDRGKVVTTLLFHEPYYVVNVIPDLGLDDLKQFDAINQRNGYGYRSYRPYTSFKNQLSYAVIADRRGDAPGIGKLGMDAAELEKFLTEQQLAGNVFSSLAGVVSPASRITLHLPA
jgi:serine/threonine protein kinase